MPRYAIMDGLKALNVVNLYEGETPPEGWQLLSENEDCAPGYTYKDGDWIAPQPPPRPRPIRITKADFQRLLIPAERYGINALRRRIAGLSVADYSNPANALLIAAEDVLLAFEQPAEFIELDHPDTYAGLMLFAYLGVLTEARVNEIVSA